MSIKKLISQKYEENRTNILSQKIQSDPCSYKTRHQPQKGSTSCFIFVAHCQYFQLGYEMCWLFLNVHRCPYICATLPQVDLSTYHTLIFFCYASAPSNVTFCLETDSVWWNDILHKLSFQQFYCGGEMTARTKASLSKSIHSGNAYVTTNGAENSTAPHTTLYSLLVCEIIQ